MADIQHTNFHPAAAFVRMMNETEYADLRDDIAIHGQIEPVIIHPDGRIIDGRNRTRALNELGQPVKTRVYDGDLSFDAILDFVWSLNTVRRQLSEFDKAQAASARANIALGDNQHTRTGGSAPVPPLEGTPDVIPPVTTKQAAEQFGTSERSIRNYRKVEREAIPEVKQAAATQTIGLRPAAEIAALPKEDQKRVIDAGDTKAILAAAKQIQAERKAERKAETERRMREQAQAQKLAAPTQAHVTLANMQTWLPKQPDADLLITDPPYMTDVENIETFAQDWLPGALAKVKPTGRAYIHIGAYPDELRAYLNVPVPNHLVLDNILVWTYRNTLGPTPKHSYKTNWQAILYYRGKDAGPLDAPIMVEQFSVQDINAPDGRQGDRWHAWQKPDELARRLITHSTKPGDLVLDPFAGTGTFLLNAARLNREAHGCDINPDNIQIAVQRGCVQDA